MNSFPELFLVDIQTIKSSATTNYISSIQNISENDYKTLMLSVVVQTNKSSNI